jgi:hypothetical protein
MQTANRFDAEFDELSNTLSNVEYKLSRITSAQQLSSFLSATSTAASSERKETKEKWGSDQLSSFLSAESELPASSVTQGASNPESKQKTKTLARSSVGFENAVSPKLKDGGSAAAASGVTPSNKSTSIKSALARVSATKCSLDHMHCWSLQIVQTLLSTASLATASSVLEVGCGPGGSIGLCRYSRK